jgi:cysteine synthase A
MSLAASYADATEACQLPRLVRLAPNLYAAAFVLMKIVPARFILRKALAEGRLEPGTIITETTSGTFGLALAMQGVHLRRKVILVSDPVIDERLYRRLHDLGAEVDRVPAAAGDGVGGYQAARLDRLAEIRREHPATFCPEQYSNPDNPRSYAAVAELMMEALGQIDCVVGPVGSGGSMSGTVTALRAMLPECAAVAVDTPGSILFGQQPGHRELRGLGMSLLPANLDHRLFDQVHWCSAAAAYRATRELHQRHALFMGPTSGAAYLAGRWYAQTNPHALTVVMMPDEGYRYQDSVYDDDWLRANGHLAGPLPTEPTVLDGPRTPGGAWTTFDWSRRGFDEVVAGYETVARP